MSRKKQKLRVRLKRRRVEIDVQQLDSIVDKACTEPLSADEGTVLKSSIHAMVERIQSGFRTTEKAKKLLGGDGSEADNNEPEADEQSPTPCSGEEGKRHPGHGRNGVVAYPGAKFVAVPHPDLSPKCLCPGCGKGKLYALKRPNTILRIKAVAPIQATVYNLEKLRCGLCQEEFPAPPPADVGEERYDCSVASMIALLHYGKGMTFYRIEALQKHLGVPLPSGTQCDLLHAAFEKLEPVLEELRDQAARGESHCTDDTGVRILDEVERPQDQSKDRVGLHTTGTVSRFEGHQIALFTSGPKHAGEKIRDLFELRPAELPPPLLMSDGLNHNTSKLPQAFKQLLANCLVHGRRQFVDVFEAFPEQCRHVIEQIGRVYHNEALAQEQGLDADARLHLHQETSGPVMGALKTWMELQIQEDAEPNSGLGRAINYFLKRWDKLTLFLRHAGAPLDNNIVERALKKAVLLRKNSLFYKTQHGAEMGDLYLSLIHTCELNDINAFDYLTHLLQHAAEVKSNPSAWMPWNYRNQPTQPGECENTS